jgi:ferredoxin
VYEAVPRINADVCAADGGCQACVGVCPVDAYQWVSGSVSFDKTACVTCGQCVTACPTGAIDNPTVSSDGIRAQIHAIVQASVNPVGVAFVCRRRTEPLTVPGWFPIEVPCTAMVPATWLLAALSLGAAAATNLPCSASGCPVGLDDRSAEALHLARDLVSAIGLDHSSIALEPAEWPKRSSVVPTGLPDPFGVHGPATVVAAFAGGGDGDSIKLEAPGAPMGVVEIDPSSCTMCTMCTSTCPTGALLVGGTPERVEITFDAGLCTGCQQCVPRCPERERGAITLHQVIDVAALRAGRVTLARGDTLTCERCGDPVAPNAMLDRIAAILGDEYSETMSYVSRRCLNCRGS